MSGKSDDPVIQAIRNDICELKKITTANSTVCIEVRNILVSFKIIATVAKWITMVGAAIAITYASVREVIPFLNKL